MTLSVFKLALTMFYHTFTGKSVKFSEKSVPIKKQSSVYVAMTSYAFNYCTGTHFFVNESNWYSIVQCTLIPGDDHLLKELPS